MNITWFGQSFFEIRTKNSAGELFNIAVDPFDESIGLKPPKIEAGILLISHNHYDHNNKKAIQGSYFLIEEPGEYEVKGVLIKGIQSFHDNVQGKERGVNIIYKIEAEGIKLCHLGDLGQKELDEKQIEEIGEVDLLFAPIGGVYTIDVKQVPGIISQIEPKIVIPMHYKIPKLKFHPVKSAKGGAKQFNGVNIEGLDKFLKVMGAERIEPQKKLKISLKDLPKEETEIVVLEP